jgi:SOS-response transcriptional repressor LexA
MKSKGFSSQESLAKRIGTTPGEIGNWTRGNRIPTLKEHWKNLCSELSTTIDYLLFGKEPTPKDFIISIESTENDKKIIGTTEGEDFLDRLVPIPIARDPISAGSPREVREDPDGVAVICRDWAKNPQNFTVVRVKGESMHPTIPDGSLVGIDHSRRDPRRLDGKVVAIRKNGEATIKRLLIVSDDLALGMPDNKEEMDKTVVLQGEELNNAIIGKVAWWWGKQK